MHKNALYQPRFRVVPVSLPATPFEQIFTDYFDCTGQHHLVSGDRLSKYSVTCSDPRTAHHKPVTMTLSSKHQLPVNFSLVGVSAIVYHLLITPQSNGRVEVAVKCTKRFLRSYTGSSETLDTDRFLHAIMQLRNTPYPDCRISPAHHYGVCQPFEEVYK